MNEQNQSPIANQQYSPQVPPSFQSSDEIDLRELLKALWDGKFIIITTIMLFAAGAVFFALKQPNIYRSQASFVLERAFYNTEGVSEPRVSPQFLSSSEVKKMMVAEFSGDASVLNGVSVSYNERDRYVIISKTSQDPKAAFDGVYNFSLYFNTVLKSVELEKVRTSIDAFKHHQESVPSLKTQEYLDELLGQQLFKEALLKSPTSRLVTQISEAVIPISHIKPKRVLIAALGTLLGGMLGVAIVLVRFAFRREEE